MPKKKLISQLDQSYRFFGNTIEVFSEEDSSFAPVDGIYTVAQQIAHTAQTVDWFIEGAFIKDQFNLNFEEHTKEVKKITSVKTAKDWLLKSFENAKAVIVAKTGAELQSPLPDGPVMGGLPRMAVIDSLVDHTAHHRGSLAVYARLAGKIPKMPYD